ncbi:MAG: hypothetical protein ACLSVD_05510 [Eggerthellaceae bacterium]
MTDQATPMQAWRGGGANRTAVLELVSPLPPAASWLDECEQHG